MLFKSPFHQRTRKRDTTLQVDGRRGKHHHWTACLAILPTTTPLVSIAFNLPTTIVELVTLHAIFESLERAVDAMVCEPDDRLLASTTTECSIATKTPRRGTY